MCTRDRPSDAKPMDTAKPKETLDELRSELDRIDRALQDLLVERAAVVGRIGATKDYGGGALRPGREARILRALVARHQGPFPKRAVVRIWREIISASVWLQEPFAVAVYEPEDEPSYWDLARAHYGMVAPHTGYRSAREVVGAVSGGRAAVGVLPMPGEADEGEPWWLHLLGPGPNTPRVIGKLPFTGVGTVRREGLQAMAIARAEPEETGDDRSWLVLESETEVSRATLSRTLAAVDLRDAKVLQMWPESGGTRLVLVDVGTYVAPRDWRIDKLGSAEGGRYGPVHRIGAYATPFDPATFADERSGS